MKRRTLLQGIPLAALLPSALAASGIESSEQSAAGVFELRVYHAAPGKLPELLTRFREHTVKIFAEHGMESVG